VDEELPHVDEDAIYTFSQACAARNARTPANLDYGESRDAEQLAPRSVERLRIVAG
jgi:hypothetical protein